MVPVLDRIRLGPRLLQVLLGLLWLLDGVLQFQPAMFRPDFFGMMLNMGPANPPFWLGDLDVHLEPFVTAHSSGVNWFAASLQVLIGAGLLLRPTARLALAASVPWALTVWLVGEAAGGIFTEGASALTGAPGPALVYALVAVLLWPRAATAVAPGCVADRGLLPRPLPRLSWAALWVGTALLEAEALNRQARAASDAIYNAGLSGPGWLAGLTHRAGDLVGIHGTLFAVTAGVVQGLIGFGVLFASTRRVALGLGMLTALAYGAFGQGFGGILSDGWTGLLHSGATDPGSAPILLLLALALWPGRPRVPASDQRSPLVAPAASVTRTPQVTHTAA